MSLDLTLDAAALTAAIVDIESVSGNERALADAVQATLAPYGHLEVIRDGNAVLARTRLGRMQRVILAGHLDTVPVAGNLPSLRAGHLLYGCGTCDMKASIAVMLRLASSLTEPRHDLTFVFYDCEEVEAARNGLSRITTNHPQWLECDLALLMEPTAGAVEAGCQGTLRATVRTTGHRAHSARSWLGSNAIHAAGEVLRRLAAYEPRTVDIDGCVYREGLNAVYVEGGVAGNVIPDECTVVVNFRFAPDRSEAQAAEHMRSVFAGFDFSVTDSAPGALPGLAAAAAQDFVAAVGKAPSAKYGWTDVSRFAALGRPALNFGPGDPNLAHTREEHVDVRQIAECEKVLRDYLS